MIDNKENLYKFKYFISASKQYCELYNHKNALYLRKKFSLSTCNTATLCITALGFYELFVNGRKITKGKLAPYVSNPEQIVFFDEYDVSQYLSVGENVIGVIFGNGFVNNMGGSVRGFDKANFRSAPKMSLSLTVDVAEVLVSDDSFKVADSPITFDDLRCGEYWDYRFEQEGWTTCQFNDLSWSNAIVVDAPHGVVEKCTAEPIKVINKIKPLSHWLVDGGVMFDFGINTAGICNVKFAGVSGQTVTLWHCECLSENKSMYNKNTCCPNFDRSLSQKDIFIVNE